MQIRFDIDSLFFFSCRFPQYLYPSTAYVAAPSTASVLTSAVPHSPLSPTAAATTGQLLDYSTAYASQFGAYEAAYPYASNAAGLITPTAAGYTYAAIPQPALVAGGSAIHYQPQQIQERMQ